MEFISVIIERENIDTILSIISDNINVKDYKGMTLLHYAVLKGKEKIVKLLLEHGANVNCKNYEFITPLHCAAQGYNEGIVKLLLNYGADVNSQTMLKWTPLHYSLNRNNKISVSSSLESSVITQKIKILKLLLNHGAQVNKKNALNWVPLHFAVVFYNKQIVHILLEYGANCNIKNNLKLFPLHYAVDRKLTEIVDLLLHHGANIYAKDFLGKTPLHYAIANQDKDILELIFNYAVNVNYHLIEDFFHSFIYLNKKNIVLDILITYIIKLKNLDFTFNKQTLEFINNRMVIYHRRCEREREAMKKTTIYTNCNITFYDFLTYNLSKVILYIKNEEDRRELITSFYEIMFPSYASMIRYRIRIATTKVQLFIEAHELLRKLLNHIFELPNDCTLRIMHYFSESDLHFFRISHSIL